MIGKDILLYAEDSKKQVILIINNDHSIFYAKNGEMIKIETPKQFKEALDNFVKTYIKN